MKHSIHAFDKEVTRIVSTVFDQRFHTFFRGMTFLGDPLAVSLITLAIMTSGLYIQQSALIVAGAAIPATVIVGALLKLGFERARPLTQYAMNMKIKTFSFPSGHSSGAVITYGLLSYLAFAALPSPLAVIVGTVLGLIAVAVGLSRVYLGAHFPSDVIAGWLLGGVALVTVVLLIRPLA